MREVLERGREIHLESGCDQLASCKGKHTIKYCYHRRRARRNMSQAPESTYATAIRISPPGLRNLKPSILVNIASLLPETSSRLKSNLPHYLILCHMDVRVKYVT